MTIAGVVLAAGSGTRLRPLTLVRPKPLCPVNNVPLVDAAIARTRAVAPDVAVNVSAGREMMERHLRERRVHLSIEEPEPLGTAGALVRLRDWIGGRDVLVVNADAWYPGALAPLAHGWDGERIRMLAREDPERPDFGGLRQIGATLIPWRDVAALPKDAFGLMGAMWRSAYEDGRVEPVVSREPFFDCGTPPDYHAANMSASGGRNVVGEGAIVNGEITRTVLWPGVTVHEGEHLVDAIRARDGVTVLVSASRPPRELDDVVE